MADDRQIHGCVVIGAGPAGLSAAYFLQRTGVDFLILERAAHVGESFRLMHQSLRLLTPASVSSLPGFPMNFPRNAYPTGLEFAEYLQKYCEHFDLPVVFGAAVSRIAQDGGQFLLQTNEGNIRAQTLIIATGQFSFPYTPPVKIAPGSHVRLMHAHDYRDHESVKGARIVVAGRGNSAAEVAIELSRAGKTLYLSTPGPIFAYPQKIFGLDLHWFFLPFEFLGHLLARTTGLRLHAGRTPVIGRAIVPLIRSGRINQKSTVMEVGEHEVRFSDGSSVLADTLIFATGYRFAAPFLGSLVRRDKKGVPITKRGGSEISGLYFVGIPDLRGPASAFIRGIVSDARAAARQVVARLATAGSPPQADS